MPSLSELVAQFESDAANVPHRVGYADACARTRSRQLHLVERLTAAVLQTPGVRILAGQGGSLQMRLPDRLPAGAYWTEQELQAVQPGVLHQQRENTLLQSSPTQGCAIGRPNATVEFLQALPDRRVFRWTVGGVDLAHCQHSLLHRKAGKPDSISRTPVRAWFSSCAPSTCPCGP